MLNSPLSVAAAGSNVFIVDAPQGITNTAQGPGTIYKNGTALANTGQIAFPYSVSTDAAGDLYYSDQSLSQVWRVDTQGNFLAVAGNGVNNSGSTCTSAAPCEATQTSILTPYGLAVSGNGSIFIGDAVATGQVGEVNVTTGMLTFPSQPTSTTSNPLTVTVTDTAAMAVGASGASLAGADMGDFAILTGVSGGTCNTATGFTLQPGHSCTILVTFTPAATGTRTAVIESDHAERYLRWHATANRTHGQRRSRRSDPADHHFPAAASADGLWGRQRRAECERQFWTACNF